MLRTDELLEVAQSQGGVFSRRQAAEHGIDRAAVRRRIRSGVWEEPVWGVLLVRGTPATWERALWVAVVEGAARDAVVSHRSAAALLRIPGFARGPVETSQRGAQYHRHSAGVLHERYWLPEHHRAVIGGFPCTTLARTVFDLMGVLRADRAIRMLEDSVVHLHLKISSLREVLDEVGKRGVKGTALARKLVEARERGWIAPESELEARFDELCAEHGLPRPRAQVVFGDETPIGRVDRFFPDAHLVVELDGRANHTTEHDRKRDRQRDNRLTAIGLSILRFSWHEVVDDPMYVVSTVRSTLRAAS